MYLIIAQPNENSKDIDFDKNINLETQKRAKTLLLILGFSVIFIGAVFYFIKTSNELLPTFIFTILVIVGLTASVLLLIHEVDKSKAFVKNICERGGLKQIVMQF